MSEQGNASRGTGGGRTPQWLQGAQNAGERPQRNRRASTAGRGTATPSRGSGQAGKRTGARGATGRFPRVNGSTPRRGSVVGARLGEASGRRQRGGLPRGGIPGQGSLTVDERALDADSRRKRGAGAGKVLRAVVIVVGVLLALVVVFLIAVTLLSNTSAFEITSVEAEDSAHVTADSIVRLAKVEDGATLLNVDTKAIEENLQKNPWILSAHITREFPDTLKIEVTERQPAYLVVMGTGNLGWYLGSDNIWIEPKRIETTGDQSVTDAAMGLAQENGAVVISEVPSSVSPAAGYACTDEEILTVESFQQQFSDDFKSQIACYSAPDTNGISCVLTDGIEVALGAASNIDTKEAVIKQVLKDYEGQITYLNVRVPSSPSYRGIKGDDLTSGTGANGTSTEGGSSFTDVVADANGDVESTDGDSSGTNSSSGSDSGSSGSASSDGTSSTSTTTSGSSNGGSSSDTQGSSGTSSASN